MERIVKKKDLFEGKQTKLAVKASQTTREALKETLGLEEGNFIRATFTLPKSDLQWLTETVRKCKRSSPIEISKSGLVRIGLNLLKEQGLESTFKGIS